MSEKIDISHLPTELQAQIFDILGKNHIPTKSVTLEQILPDLDLTTEQKEKIIKVLSPESKREALNHEKLEGLLNKFESKSKKPNPNIKVIKDELEKRKRGR